MNEVIVVDADGNRLSSNVKRLVKPKWRLKMFAKSPVMKPRNPSKKDLSRLDDAIWQHGGETRIKFLNVYKDIVKVDKDLIEACTDADEKFKKYLEDFIPASARALRHCWVELKWRPSECGNRVLFPTSKSGVPNPYLKNGTENKPENKED